MKTDAVSRAALLVESVANLKPARSLALNDDLAVLSGTVESAC